MQGYSPALNVGSPGSSREGWCPSMPTVGAVHGCRVLRLRTRGQSPGPVCTGATELLAARAAGPGVQAETQATQPIGAGRVLGPHTPNRQSLLQASASCVDVWGSPAQSCTLYPSQVL